MKRYYFCFLFVFCLMALTPLYAATQTLTTYYPAPQGNYKNVQVATENVSSDLEVGPTTSPIYGGLYTFSPLLYTMDVDGVINDAEGGISLGYLAWGLYGVNNANTLGFDFQADGYGNVIEAVTTGANPRLQFMSVDVAGVTGVAAAPTEIMTLNDAGNLGIGNISPTHALDVTGQANITGNTTLGTGPGNATTINGSTTVSGLASLNGGATVPAGATVQVSYPNGIQYCNAGLCEPLEVVLGSDGNYYAAYGP